ncbi:SMI1/KNR4 family protein [Streptomyces lincolnensis]|uniref:SMI1/KNR4 family protein n=1 Tax=Streptomyces lincolnensis TaxID=1915 RepID=UPI00082DF968|nr:SMI1/KNR4 family protein [Streptomyces lincolnensis]QMV07908.1 cell wall assembly protein [Streptomyces lincolnensis]
MGETTWNGVRERVKTLARADKAQQVFGAWGKYGGTGHRFHLADPLSEAEVSGAEAQWGISLPADYRAFLLEVGAGGAGPGYGLTTLSRSDAGWLWSDPGGGTVHERLRVPFPGGEESVRAQAEHERKEPVESDFEDEAAFDVAYRAWLKDDERLSDWFLSGAVCLSHEGCGYFHWLVVSGPQCGQVWLDERPGDGRLSPLGQFGFADWYLDWVEKTEAVVRTAHAG